jgi:outer membrane protein assembly factor BamB
MHGFFLNKGVRFSTVALLAFVTESQAQTRNLAEFANTQYVESVSIYPRYYRGDSIDPIVFELPMRTSSGFGGSQNPSVLKNNSKQGSTEVLYKGTLLSTLTSSEGIPVCGPSPKLNSFACYALPGGEKLSEVPLPGKVTSVPLFAQKSWIVGTSKGFLIKLKTDNENSAPEMGGNLTVFWGGKSREATQRLRGKTPTSKADPKAPPVATQVEKPLGWDWYHAGSTEYIGTPVTLGSFVYALNASQTLEAFDWNTGRLVWATRLAPEATLRLEGTALAATSKEVIAGTNEGRILVLKPDTGALLWAHNLPLNANDRFKSTVALPTIEGRSMFVSNAESATQRVNLDSRAVEWTYPMGSVAAVKISERAAYLSGADGTLVKLDAASGKLEWKTSLTAESPLASLFVSKNGGQVLVASKNGAVSVVDARDGRLLSKKYYGGEVVGEFSPGVNEQEACLTFSFGSFQCFRFITL